jgi:hypothetical protein
MLGSNRLVLYRPPWEVKAKTKPPSKAAPPVDEQALVLQFVTNVGGFENARQALALLQLLRGERPQNPQDDSHGGSAAA